MFTLVVTFFMIILINYYCGFHRLLYHIIFPKKILPKPKITRRLRRQVVQIRDGMRVRARIIYRTFKEMANVKAVKGTLKVSTKCVVPWEPWNRRFTSKPRQLLDLGNINVNPTAMNIYTLLKKIGLLTCLDNHHFTSIYNGSIALTVETNTSLDNLEKYFYMVVFGCLELRLNGKILRVIDQGEAILSYLQLLKCMLGDNTVSGNFEIIATKPSKVVQVDMTAFRELSKSPEITVRLVQYIMVYIQRTTFYVLTHHFGLHVDKVYCKKKFTYKDWEHECEFFTEHKISNRMNIQMYVNEIPFSKSDKEDNLIKRGIIPSYLPYKLYSTEMFNRKIEKDKIVDFLKVLGMDRHVEKFEHDITSKAYPQGHVIFNKRSIFSELQYIVSGTVELSIDMQNARDNKQFLHAGNVIHLLSVLSNEPSIFSLKCHTDCVVACISQKTFYTMLLEDPNLIIRMTKLVLQVLEPIVYHMDYAFDLKLVQSGTCLFRQEDKCGRIYSIIGGRLRSIYCKPREGESITDSLSINELFESRQVIGEYIHGDILGLAEYVLSERYRYTCLAVRDTEMAVIYGHTFNYIREEYPCSNEQFASLLGGQVVQRLNAPLDTYIPSKKHTVALVPLNEDVCVERFSLELQHSLGIHGDILRLSEQVIKLRLGMSAFNDTSRHRLSSWLAYQEDIHRFVIYECSHDVDCKWNDICVRQADIVLSITNEINSVALTEMDNFIKSSNIRATKHLVILYRIGSLKPSRTGQWLEHRTWCTGFHHIRCPTRAYRCRNRRVYQMYKKVFSTNPDSRTDISRLARYLSGNSIGLVLGGGGARGGAHLGVIKVLNKLEIPIDFVGGVSIGSLVGAIYCMEPNLSKVNSIVYKWFMSCCSWWNKAVDLTYPIVSLLTGRRFNYSLKLAFGNKQIEDLWVPFFCISTDLTDSTIRVHRQGCLWQYVRASMTLTGYLPPLCDPTDGHLLVDGGYMNFLPIDIMQEFGMKKIIAVDVGAATEMDFTDYGNQLSGFWVMFKKFLSIWNKDHIKVLGIAEIQTRLTYVCGVQKFDCIRNTKNCLYLRPPVQDFGTLQFNMCETIKQIGYDYAYPIIDNWYKTEYKRDVELKCEAHENKLIDFIDIVDFLSSKRHSVVGQEVFSEPGALSEEDALYATTHKHEMDSDF